MSQEYKKVTKIGVFFDGRPGHEKQTEGILRCLQKRLPVETVEFIIQRASITKEIGNWLRYFLLSNAAEQNCIEEFDLLIGTGSRTHIPMLSLKKRYGLPVVTCMSPSSLLLDKFDLCFVPQHDGLQRKENVFQTIGPPNISTAQGHHDPKKGLVLIGGIDEKSHSWQTETLRKQLLDLFGDSTIQTWTVTTSPRTPADTEQMVFSVTGNYQHVDFFPFKETKRGWLEEQYSQNRYVWVTADSMSMVYEALSADCRVGLLPVKWKQKRSKFRRSEEFLIEKGYVVSFESWNLDKNKWPTRGTLNEADRCAKEIIKRFLSKA